MQELLDSVGEDLNVCNDSESFDVSYASNDLDISNDSDDVAIDFTTSAELEKDDDNEIIDLTGNTCFNNCNFILMLHIVLWIYCYCLCMKYHLL